MISARVHVCNGDLVLVTLSFGFDLGRYGSDALGIVVNTVQQEAEAGGSEVQCHPLLHRELEASLGCMRP